MKFNRLKISSLVAFVVFVALTAYLFAYNRARRRAHVPAKTISLPPITNHKTGKPFLFRGQPRASHVNGLAFAPQRQQLAITDANTFLYLANVETGDLRRIDNGGMKTDALFWSRDGRRILEAHDGTLSWHAPRAGKWQSFVAFAPKDRWNCHLVPSASGRFALVATAHDERVPVERAGPWQNGSLWLTEVPTGKRLWGGRLKADSQGLLPLVCGLAFSPDEKMVAVVSAFYGDDSYDGPNGKSSDATNRIANTNPYFLRAKRVELLLQRVRDGKTLSAAKPLLVYIPNLVNDSRSSRWFSLSFSPDAKFLAVVDGREVHLFSVQTGSEIATLKATSQDSDGPKPMDFSPDGRLLAVGRFNAIEIWDVKTKRCLQLFYSQFAPHLSFSADSKWLASDNINSDKVSIWEVGSLLQ